MKYFLLLNEEIKKFIVKRLEFMRFEDKIQIQFVFFVSI